MKKVMKNIIRGIAWGCTVFVIMGVIFALVNGDRSMYNSKEFIRNAICAMIVGIGFVLPSMIYDNDKITMGIKVLIHMGTGFLVYFIAAYIAGWISFEDNIATMILTVLSIIAVSFVIWFCFYQYYKN